MKVLNKGHQPTITEVIIGTGELWTPYRDLRDVVERALVDVSPESMDEVQQMLAIHKPDFISLLSSKGCNAADRQELRNSGGEGAYFKGHEGKQVLPPQLINEAILLSDMFNINEFLALDLLATAETEMDKHPGWGRGLLAVYLYYEGRNAIVQSLLTIIQALPGKTWASTIPSKVVELFQSVFDAVFCGDMMDRLLVNFEQTSEKAAMEMLDSNLALGDWRHRSEISKFIISIRLGLAQIVFCWCAQHRVSWKDTLRLLDHLKAHVTTQPEAVVLKDDVLLISSLLFCISNNITLTDIDEAFVKGMKKYIKDNETAEGFQSPELLDFYKLAFYTKVYKVVSETNISTSRGRSILLPEAKTNLLKSDDEFELKTDVFSFLKKYIFLYPKRYSDEENSMRRMHELFVDFISYMPIKLKELKNRSEDAAKTATLYYEQGIHRPPNLPREYESFLECIGLFYYSDVNELGADFFSLDPHLAALSKFVRSACNDPNALFICNAKMLTGLASSFPSGIFNVLKQTGHTMCIDHFFKSMMKYLSSYGVELNFDGPIMQRFEMNPGKMMMNPAETNSICCYLDLIETLCRGSESVRNYFCSSNFVWVKMCFHMGKIRSVPVEIRAKTIQVAAAMIPSESASPEIVTNLWDLFYKTKLIDQGVGDLRTELEDRETRDTTYPLTIALLKLMKALIDARFPQTDYNMLEHDFRVVFDNGAFDPYVAYICDSILLKFSSRSYKNVMDRWNIGTLALNIVSSLLDVVSSFMFQLLCDSPLLRSCLQVLFDCNRVREMSTGEIPHVDKCSWQCLTLILRVLQRQTWFLYHRDTLPNKQTTVIIGLHDLLMRTVIHTGRPEYLLTIVKFVDRLNPEQHRSVALEIVAFLVAEHSETDLHLYSTITSDNNVAIILRHTVTQMLYDVNCDDSLKSTILQLIRSSVVHSAPNLALYLLGVDKKIEFQNPGVQNYPITVLHALVDNCSTLQDAFATILVLIRDPVLWHPLLKYLRSNHFFTKLLLTTFPNNNTSLENIGQFLKVMAVELKNSHHANSLALKFLERKTYKFQDILSRFEVDNQSIELPLLEFFDPSHISGAIQTCEVYQGELKVKIIRVEMLEALLREQIRELEKNVVVRLRKSINLEAKEITIFARQLNSMRRSEAAKMLVLDGWRQCLEVMVLSPNILSVVGVDFVTSMLRVLLIKITSSVSPSNYFLRLSAETTLTLCAVIRQLRAEVSPTIIHVILKDICSWANAEQSPSVRALLYSCILYLLLMFKNEGINAYGSCLTVIMDTLCRDSFQPTEVGRMQSMNLIGEILRLTSNKGLDGNDTAHLYKTAVNTTLILTSGAAQVGGDVPNKSESNLNVSNESFRTEVPTSVSQLLGGSKLPFETNNSTIRNASKPALSYSQTNILNHILVKGYVRKLVDDLSLVDDANLIQLFSNNPEKVHMRAMYAFEAKMSLLCRLAVTGSKATCMLMDVNMIHKLTDMNVFGLNCISSKNSQNARRKFHFSGNSNQSITPPGVAQIDLLFSTVFKLFHVMLTAAPRNMNLINQIWHFITTHDVAVGSLLNPKYIPENTESCSVLLFTSLMAKISQKLPANAINRKHCVYSKILDILRVYAEECNDSEFSIRIVRNVMMFLCGHARNHEAAKEEVLSKRHCRVVLKPDLQLDFSKNLDDDLAFGVILKIINHAASKLSALAALPSPAKLISNLTVIIECGLTLVYFHTEIFIAENFPKFTTYDQDINRSRQQLIVKAEVTAKQISDISKLTPHSEYLDTLLLRFRRLQV